MPVEVSDDYDNYPKWLKFEVWLTDTFGQDGGQFTAQEYADAKDIYIEEASDHIQAYKGVQQREDSPAMYTIYRVPGTRTRAAVWIVGDKSKDVDLRAQSLCDDFEVAVDGFVKDETHMMTRNPRARRRAIARKEAVRDGVVKVMRVAVGLDDPDDE